MSEDINSVIIVGRLTRDSELVYSNSGFAICNFSIASNRSKKVGDNWEEEANFFDLVLLGKRGEALNRYLVKGQQVAIDGALQQDRWEQDGQKRSKVKILVNKIQLIGSKKSEGSNSGQPSGSSDYSEYKKPDGPSSDQFGDDVPF